MLVMLTCQVKTKILFKKLIYAGDVNLPGENQNIIKKS